MVSLEGGNSFRDGVVQQEAAMQSPGRQTETNAIMKQHLHAAAGGSIGKEKRGAQVRGTEDVDNQCQARSDAGAHIHGFCGEAHGVQSDDASTSRSHCALGLKPVVPSEQAQLWCRTGAQWECLLVRCR